MSETLESRFVKAYDEYADAIFRHCYFRLSDGERAKDLVQDAFVRSWGYLSKGGKVDSLKAFLYRIANNLIIDEWRRKKAVSLDVLAEAEGFDPPAEERLSVEDRADLKKITARLAELESPYKEAVIMRFVDDLTPKEIAEITGESENVISVRVHRGLGKLKEIVNKNA